MSIKTLSSEVLNKLIAYDWPGNVRELENCVEWMMIVSQQDIITAEALPLEIIEKINFKNRCNGTAESEHLGDIERAAIIHALETTQGNKSLAAKKLNIGRKALYNRLKKYNLF